MKRPWNLIGMGVLVTALALAAMACGGGDKKDTSATKTAAYQTPEATQPAAETSQPVVTTEPTAANTPVEGVTVIAAQDPQLGAILADPSGRTLYKFANDTAGVSNCDATCAQTWPPLTIAGGTPAAGEGVTGELGVTQRSDGASQVTYDGSPLYYFSADTEPGDIKGNGFVGLWSVINLGG